MKKVTIADIAQMAGVSTATVIRVLHQNGYVAEDKKAAVMNAVKKSGYVAANKGRRVNTSNFIGILLPWSDNLYHQKLLQYLSRQIRRKGCYTVTCVLEKSNCAGILAAIKELQENGIRGVINLVDPGREFSQDMLRQIRALEIPVLMLERGGGYGLDRVLVDAKEGIYIAAQYLIGCGHRHLAYIGRETSNEPYSDEVDAERKAGFEKAIRDNRDNIESSIIELTEDFPKEMGYDAMKCILMADPLVTGVVAAADSLAAGAMDYLFERKISVPEEISIIGHDDTYAEFLTPSLTTVAMPYEEMAEAAVDIILQKNEKSSDLSAKTLVLSPKLVIRKSVSQI